MLSLVIERLLQRALSGPSQMQSVGAPIGGRRVAAYQAQVFELIDGRHQIGALDAERRADPCLAQAWVAADDGHYGKLTRSHRRRPLTRNEIGKYRQLSLPQHVAHVLIEVCEIRGGHIVYSPH